MGEGPVRTCIGCRRTAPATALLRIVVDPESDAGDGALLEVVLDPWHRLPGRGAWLHDDPGCVGAALTRRAVGRALRQQVPLDLTAVEALRDRQHEHQHDGTTSETSTTSKDL